MLLLRTSRALLALDLAGFRGVRHYSKHGSRLGQTSVFVQTGLKIRELPLVVKKVNDVLCISGMDGYKRVETPKGRKEYGASVVTEETEETLAGFRRCFSVHGVFKLLETIPAEEVTPPVAIFALQKIIEMENTYTFRSNHNSYRKAIDEEEEIAAATPSNETFVRIAFINMLLDIVYRCRDPEIILQGLDIVSRDTFPGDQTVYKERMCEETLVCVSEGIFNLKQICDAVKILSEFFPEQEKSYDAANKMWSGIMDKSDVISANNISTVFLTLPHLHGASRDIIFKMVEGRVGDFWNEYQTRDVLEILGVLKELDCSSTKILRVLSQWLKVNLHMLSEEETLAVIYCLHELDYIDDTIIATMEKYMRVRGCQIEEQDLVATLCDYCLDFRVRSKTILEGAAEYLIEHGETLSTPQFYSVARIFGELSFHPPNGFKFWDVVENVLEKKFGDLPPKEAINLMLSFIYLERYPLNFVRKIFNPYFMDRLHQQSPASMRQSRMQLKLFDVVMKAETKTYNGPYLPKDRGMGGSGQMGAYRQGAVPRTAKALLPLLGEVVGDINRVNASTFLVSMLAHPLFQCDMMIYPSAAASLLSFGNKAKNSRNIGVLLFTEEDYVRGKGKLIGPQAMRKRMLSGLGFKIIELDLDATAKMLKGNRKQLKKLLHEKYFEVMTKEI